MATAYTLYFSDPRKAGTITVPGTGTGPGKNNYDTSLELVGPGYVNYGSAIAQNFLKLLENFSGPNPPLNPVEGQVWYDTSNLNRKTLRVHNGSLTSQGWPSATGIYQQINDPSEGSIATVKDGDIWVDLSKNQLKIRSGPEWITVGPSSGSGVNKTGMEAAQVESNTNQQQFIIKNYVNGQVVEIISYNEFTPRTVIDGFSTLKPGINLTSKINARYNGVADRAAALEVSPGVLVRAGEILKNRATSQTHTGTFVIESSTGLIIRNPIYNNNLTVSATSVGGQIDFSNPDSSLKIGIQDNSYLKFNGQFKNIGINTTTSSSSPTLDVFGGARFTDAVRITSQATNSIDAAGGARIAGTTVISGGLTVATGITSNRQIVVGSPGVIVQGGIIEPAINGTYDLGSPNRLFRQVFASVIGTTGTVFRGTFDGPATQLSGKTAFSIAGQVQSLTALEYDGSQSIMQFVTTLTRDAVAAQPTITSATPTHTLLVLNTATGTTSLEKISKSSFLSDVYPGLVKSGMIVAAGMSSPMSGFLLCNGDPYSQIQYPTLFSAIGTTYGQGGAGTFRVPDLRNVMQAAGGITINYYIKT